MERSEEVRREVIQEVFDYIDGDAENGPRTGVKVTEEDIEEAVLVRLVEETPFWINLTRFTDEDVEWMHETTHNTGDRIEVGGRVESWMRAENHEPPTKAVWGIVAAIP
jgi:hypothetical protein